MASQVRNEVELTKIQKKPTLARKLALIVVGLNGVLILTALVLIISLPGDPPEGGVVWAPWILGYAVYSVLAVLIISQQPDHAIGWIFLIESFFMGLVSMGFGMGVVLEPRVESEFVRIMISAVVEVTWIIALLIPVTVVLQFFPDGRLPSRRWWPITLASILAVFVMFGSFTPDILGFTASQGFLDFFELSTALLITVAVFGSLAAVVVRVVRSQGAERLQMKWLVYTFVVGIFIAILLILLLDDDDPILGFYITLLPSMFGIAIGIAILRYRLFDIDIIIRRTLQYAIVTAILVLTYFGMVLIFQALLAAVGEFQDGFLIVISTLVVAGLFNPLRLRVQDSIDRRFYRKKYRAEQALAQFATTARDEVDIDKLTAALLAVIEETIQPESSSILLVSEKRLP